MPLRNTLASMANKFFPKLYTNSIKSIVDRMGLHEASISIYDGIVYGISDGTYVCTISGVEAQFLVTSPTEFRRYDTLVGEQRVLERLIEELRPDDIFYDVGANTGLYSCLTGQLLQEGHVVAFEPHPTNADRLEENVSLNELEVQALRVALSDHDGAGSLGVAGDDVGAGHHRLVADDGAKRTVTVDVRTGDSIVRDGTADPPDVMKIDVEGGELAVLRGFTETLQTCRLIICEAHGLTEAKEAHKQLEALEYDVEVIENRECVTFLLAERPSSN